MKYLHKPKTKSIIFFLILIAAGTSLNLLLFAMEDFVIEYNPETFQIIHMTLPVIYCVIICMIFSYFLFTLEIIISNFNSNLQLRVLNLLGLVEIGVGILGILFTGYIGSLEKEGEIGFLGKTIYGFLGKTIYFESLTTTEDIVSVLQYWVVAFLYTLFIPSIILFFAAARQSKIKKRIRLCQMEKQFKEEINQVLGFDYESSDFYQQLNIPYQSLQQSDGTLGEFEVYYKLRKSGMTNAKYIFNREIPKTNGLNTELDLVVIHNKGIFVIENKHYTTRVYGNALDHDLTLIDHNGNKKSFYNPIKQNENHVLALKEFLKSKKLYIDDEITPIYSIVVFTAEENDRTDDIISGISTAGTETKICTSQNVYHIINQLISGSDSIATVNVLEINEVLFNLPIRKKYS